MLCSLFAGGSAAEPTSRVAPDQVETQPVDVLMIEPPAEPKSMISPEHSAASKRKTFQNKGLPEGMANVKVKAPQKIATPQNKPDATPVALPDESLKKTANEFTESEEARKHDALLYVFLNLSKSYTEKVTQLSIPPSSLLGV